MTASGNALVDDAEVYQASGRPGARVAIGFAQASPETVTRGAAAAAATIVSFAPTRALASAILKRLLWLWRPLISALDTA
jgi:hypothetical protein